MNENKVDPWKRDHGLKTYDIVRHGAELGHVTGLVGSETVAVEFDGSRRVSKYLDYRELRSLKLFHNTTTLNQREVRILKYLELCHDCTWIPSLIHDLEPFKCDMKIPQPAKAKSVFDKWSRRLFDLGLIREVRDSDGAKGFVQITGWGKDAVSSAS